MILNQRRILSCRAQGKGIFLFTKLSQISDWRTDYRWRPENQQVETYVVQKYISNPFLVGGKKVIRLNTGSFRMTKRLTLDLSV